MTTRLRPNVLAHPSPTTGRFLLLIAALASAGMLTGSTLYTIVYQDEFAATAKACFAIVTSNQATSTEEILARGPALDDCMAPQRRLDATFSFSGAGSIVVLGI